MFKWSGKEQPPEFDTERAKDCLGKYVLIGITHVTQEDTLLGREELHGVIREVAPEGVRVELHGNRAGEIVQIPPALEFLSLASPGEYRLRSTGEVVVNPDLLWTWTVVEAADN